MSNETPEPARPRNRRGRTPAISNTVIGGVILAVVAVLALEATQSPPPAIAEFAPSVPQLIKQAPQAQAGTAPGKAAGTGPGAGPKAAPTPPPAPTKPPLKVPPNLILHCVGSPPRQIEDSQSPPCIPYWHGDNGGATAPGVTATSIYVSIFTGQTPQGETVREFEAWRNFFNSRFQFYGRKLVFQYCTSQSQGGDPQTDAANAMAGCSSGEDATARAQNLPTGHRPFATPGYQSNYYVYDKQTACNSHAITIVGLGFADKYMRYPANCYPYFWQYGMSNENVFANMGQWTCARLAGKAARFAAGTNGAAPPAPLNKQPRKFGLIVSDIGEGAGDPTSTPATYNHLLSDLAACGVHIDKQDIIVNPSYTNAAGFAAYMARLKQDNVTSVMCMAVFGTCIEAMKLADQQPYFPEWLSTSYSSSGADVDTHALPADQRAHLFGLAYAPRQVNPQLDPWYQAIKSVDPNDALPTDSSDVALIRIQYWDLLLLASGIQMAGPHLTPQSFADGLWRTQFPNPVTSLQEGAVGFAGHSLEMTNDSAEWFISNTARGAYSDSQSGAGVTCYVNAGRRTATGQWVKGPDNVFFTNACDSGG
jgi:hypothetical protein